MGYHSDWKLAARGEAKQLRALKSWAENTAKLLVCGPDGWETRAGWFDYFRVEFARTKITAKCGLIVLEGEGVKCYGEFGAVVSEILAYGRDELGLDMAYARLGEDYDDIQTDNGYGTYIPVLRSLGDVE